MDASYSVSADPTAGLVVIRVAGFFTETDVDGLSGLCLKEFARLGALINRHVTLIDATAADIQSHGALARFGELLADPRLQGRRLAIVTPFSLARSQARRLARDRTAQVFDTMSAAETWLFERSSRAA